VPVVARSPERRDGRRSGAAAGRTRGRSRRFADGWLARTAPSQASRSACGL